MLNNAFMLLSTHVVQKVNIHDTVWNVAKDFKCCLYFVSKSFYESLLFLKMFPVLRNNLLEIWRSKKGSWLFGYPVLKILQFLWICEIWGNSLKNQYFVNNCFIEVRIWEFFCTHVTHITVINFRKANFIFTKSIFSQIDFPSTNFAVL